MDDSALNVFMVSMGVVLVLSLIVAFWRDIPGHIDDILTALGVAVVAYGVSWWSVPAAIVFTGVALVVAGLLVGSAARRR